MRRSITGSGRQSESYFLVRLKAIRIELAEDSHAFAYHFAANQTVRPDIRTVAHDPRSRIQVGTRDGGYILGRPICSSLTSRRRTSWLCIRESL